MNIKEFHLQLFGLLMIFYVVITLGFSSFFELLTSAAKKNIDKPVMALEFVRKAKDVEDIIKNSDKARNGLKTFLILDTFAFVPLYFAFLLLMSFFLTQTSFERSNLLGLTVVFISVLAAIADWTENFYSYKALDAVFSNSEENVPFVFIAAHVKWIALFISTGILSAIFWRGGWWNIAAVLLLSSSLIGLFGLFLYRPILTLSLIIQMLVILVTGSLFLSRTCRLSFLNEG